MLVADEQAARAQLERMVAADEDPPLTTDDVDRLLAAAKRVDAGAVLPSEDGWIPTWDLDAAAADGWETKAGLAAARFDFATKDKRFDRSQVHAQCMAMARSYRRGSRGSARVRSGALDDFADAAVEGLVPFATSPVPERLS